MCVLTYGPGPLPRAAQLAWFCSVTCPSHQEPTPPLQTSQDAAPLNHMALTEISRPNRVATSVATSLDSSTEPKLCMRRKVLEYPMDIVDILPRHEPITDMGLVNATNSLKMSTELRPSTPSEMREHRIHGTCSYHGPAPLCPGFRPTVFMLGCRV